MIDSWQPMDTAPKTGENVDLWVRDKFGLEYRTADCRWHKAQECWKTSNYTGAGFNKLGRKEILFWMPLPSAPEDHKWHRR